MKKSLLLGFLLIECVALVGCQKSETEVSQPENPENDITQAIEEPEEDNVNFVLPEGAKTSLTIEELKEIAETNFPTSSTCTIVDLETEETTERETLYHEDTPHNLVNITPEFAPTTEQKLLSSGIEDGMIYSDFDVTFDNGTTGNMLYINDPVTLEFVAATVESEGISVNYQFVY